MNVVIDIYFSYYVPQTNCIWFFLAWLILCFLRIFLVVFSGVWIFVITVTTYLSIYFWIWKFFIIDLMVGVESSDMDAIYLPWWPPSSLPCSAKQIQYGSPTYRIIICIPIWGWFDENECTRNYHLPSSFILITISDEITL